MVDGISCSFLSQCAVHNETATRFGFAEPERHIGCGLYNFNIRAGVRDSVAAAVLGSKYKELPNLTVLYGATASRVLFDEAKTAIAVEYQTEGEEAASIVRV